MWSFNTSVFPNTLERAHVLHVWDTSLILAMLKAYNSTCKVAENAAVAPSPCPATSAYKAEALWWSHVLPSPSLCLSTVPTCHQKQVNRHRVTSLRKNCLIRSGDAGNPWAASIFSHFVVVFWLGWKSRHENWLPNLSKKSLFLHSYFALLGECEAYLLCGESKSWVGGRHEKLSSWTCNKDIISLVEKHKKCCSGKYWF